MATLDSLCVQGDLAVSGAISGQGFVPLGGVMPVAASLTGAYSIPASGCVDDNGYMLADGTQIPACASASISGCVPNLTSSRFARGTSSSVGACAGSDTHVLCICNMPSHTHNIDNAQVQLGATQSGTAQVQLSGSTNTGGCEIGSGTFNTGNQSANHRHENTCTNNTGSHTHYFVRPNYAGGWSGAGGGNVQGANTGSSGSHSHTAGSGDQSASHTHSYDHTHGNHSHTMNHDHSTHVHNMSHDHGTHTHTLGSTGSGCNLSSVPSYYTVVYLYRVK